MNLLNNTGIQDDLNSKIKHSDISNDKNNQKKHEDVEKFRKNTKKKDKKHRSITPYFNLIQLIALVLFLFFSYSLYLSSLSQYSNKNEMDFTELFSELSNNQIFSINFLYNDLEIILDYNESSSIYEDYDYYDSRYGDVRFLINNKESQIHIKDSYNLKNNIDFYDLFSIISYIEEINIEKDIINNNLIIVGDSIDIVNIFEATKIYNYNFKLNLIKSNNNNKYYQMTILND
tara:strand:- start:3 stop:698 length:696 start_codon:yes stop_codon:yes gene_type:complete